ncbi:MAG: PAS domain S-box protein [Thermoplasmata archaeon]|nr:PAS domain S-box protein [Thermoplasmata archaeon]
MRFVIVGEETKLTKKVEKALSSAFKDASFIEARAKWQFEEALEKSFDAVITDFELSWGSGIQVLREAKKRMPFKPVIMLIDAGMQEVAAQALKRGLDDYVLKGEIEKISSAVANAIEKCRAKEKETMLSSIIENAREAVVSVDGNGNIIYVNKATEKIFGWKEEELIGKPISIMAVDTEEQRRQFEEAIKRDGMTFETVRKDRNGNPIPVLMTVVPFKEEKGRLLFSSGVMIDIREIKAYQSKIEHLNELLKAIRGINQIITREKNEEELIKKACNLLHEVKGYKMVCISYKNKIYLEGDKREYKKLIEKMGRAGKKKINGNAYVINLKEDGIKGKLCVVHSRNFEKEEIELLKEVASDISFALHSIKINKEKEEAERRYHTIAEMASEGICIDDAKEKMIFVNEAFAKALGYKKEELLGKNFTTLVYKEDKEKVKEEIEKRKKGEASKYEVRLIAKDGSIKTFFVSSTPIYENGKFAGSLSVNLDVTQLKELEKKFEAIFEGALDAIFIEDLNGNILDVNRAACKLLGYTKDELTKMNVADIVPKEIRKRFKELIEVHLKRGGIKVEAVNIDKNGRAIPVEVSTTLIDIGGEKRIVAIVRDITERKKMEEMLRESEEKYRLLAENLPLGVFISVDTQIIYMNKFGKEMMKKNFPSLYEKFKKEKKIDLSLAIKESGASGKKIKKAIEKAMKGFPVTIEMKMPAGNYINIRFVIFKYKGRNAILGIAEDVTELRMKEQELKKNLKYLQRFHDATIDRELKMIELKKRLKECEEKLKSI